MLGTLIHLFEATILGLLVLGGYRVYRLTAEETQKVSDPEQSTDGEAIFVAPEPELDVSKLSKAERYDLKLACLVQAQSFAGNQLLEIKRTYRQTEEMLPNWLEEAISLYLIGAVDFISKQERCETKARKDVITTILKSNLKLNPDQAQAYFTEAVCREPNSDNDNMVLAGANAARAWLQQKVVPDTHKLSTQVQSWGVLA